MGETPKAEPNYYENALAKMGLQLFRESTPLRVGLTEDLMDFQSGQMSPTESPMFAPAFSTMKGAVEDQYGVAKENILRSMPEGGALSGSMADLEMARAGDIGRGTAGLTTGIVQDMLNKSYGLATGNTDQATGMLGGVADTFGERQAQEMAAAQSSNSAMSDLMKWVGLSVGAAVGGPAGAAGGYFAGDAASK